MSLKITINNEEVVCNNNIQIKEEMLSTSSTILKNCYPKTWELDKDYVSRYYFPKDYSKCKITNDTYHPEELGTIVKGSNLNINYNNTKRWELKGLYGNTSQNGTPTPSSPVEIQNVTGLQNINVCGKNLLNNVATTQEINDITFTRNSDGSFNVNGTASAIATLNLIDKNFILPAGQYTLSGCPTGGGTNTWRIDINNGAVLAQRDEGNGATFTLSQDLEVFNVRIRIANGVNVNNLTFKPMLEVGNQKTTYEPYTGTTYEVNLGKNLFDKDNANIVNGYFTPSSTTITADNNHRIIYIPCNSNTTYTIQKSNVGTQSRFGIGTTTSIPEAGTNVNQVARNNTATSQTITTNSTAKYLVVWCYFTGNTEITFDDLLATIQIEKGPTATSYTPYFTPIELNKIGNYEDKIYKQDDKWYIEKNIQKVVITGSTAGIYQSGNLTNVMRMAVPSGYNLGGNSSSLFCDKLKVDVGYNHNYEQIYVSNNIFYVFVAKSRGVTDVNTFKTWLSTNNLICYVVLATPTITEITNEDLLNQLESIYSMNLKNGVNNIISTSENLPISLEIHYNYHEAYTNEDLIFCGCVKNTGKISLNPREPHFVDLQVLDFKTLLSEGETLNYVITGKTIVEAINQVVSSISDYGFIVGNIEILNPNDIINAYSTLNKTAYDVFQYIADITQSRWTTRMIDENTIAIDFYDPTLMPTGTPIESTQAYYENNQIIDISFNYSTNDYRNKQIMTSDEVYANITQSETIIADGYATSFMCENKIGTITSITLNGINQTFITKNEEQLGYSGDFVYQPGENTFISSNSISAGGVIVITYYAIVKGREIIINSSESSRIETQVGRKGIISRYENRNDSTSSVELQKIGQSYIKYKGNAEIQLKVKTKNNLWNVGEILSYNAPLEELSNEYMVKSKEVDWYAASNETFYIYELTSNYNYEKAINYFDNQRAKNQGNIGEGQTISRNIDLESTALIKFYDTTINEVQIQNPTSLDFALDGVLI